MPDELQVQVPGCDGLDPSTKRALLEKISDFGQTLLHEAQRLEAANRYHNGPAQVTVTDVNDANTLVRRGRVHQKKDVVAAALYGASALAGVAAGYFTNHTDQPWGVLGLVFCATTTVSCGVAGLMR